jgi:hypothetical protein
LVIYFGISLELARFQVRRAGRQSTSLDQCPA